eukprot:CAMPEP_0178439004 /NCGR_PEP_ID=MMETSP0689_2-20121128/35913_1 /TAXON_ID=160604 /ORGANISM="Amphidinium massartii, Strain CS-259" /LENGTH=301 /DNA_ID=CAMNT_0020061481 /DNA_START=102 /DNA_END=1004 /DNA_ORIENTATION=+
MVSSSVVACERAAQEAYKVLAAGGSAVDAVERAVNSMEADAALNAGYGCSLNANGEPELDALIMDGSLSCGAVAGVQVLHPISLARRVMEDTDHVLVAGAGAMQLAASFGQTPKASEELVTNAAKEEWKRWQQYDKAVGSLFSARTTSADQPRGDTVGCVALDASGGIACGTSTGGVVGKRPGRVGDSPLVGSGGYADKCTGAVSTTGHGEAIAKVTLARYVLWLIEAGAPPAIAAQQALQEMQHRAGTRGGGRGGMVLITADATAVASFNTKRMPWALQRGDSGQSDAAVVLSGVDEGFS